MKLINITFRKMNLTKRTIEQKPTSSNQYEQVKFIKKQLHQNQWVLNIIPTSWNAPSFEGALDPFNSANFIFYNYL